MAVGRSFFSPSLRPPLPPDERATSMGQVLRAMFLGIIPILLLMFAALGSTLMGLATPTEAAAMGAKPPILLALA